MATTAPVTACVPVSGRGPAGGGWRPRLGWLPSPPGSRAGPPGVVVGRVPPPPVGPPGSSLGPAARRVPDRVFSGS